MQELWESRKAISGKKDTKINPLDSLKQSFAFKIISKKKNAGKR